MKDSGLFYLLVNFWVAVVLMSEPATKPVAAGIATITFVFFLFLVWFDHRKKNSSQTTLPETIKSKEVNENVNRMG